MSVNVAIVEDESEYARELQDYLRRYGREVGERFDITVYPDGEDIVDDYRSGMYDIILMDMAQYAIRGYRVDALDYVLKPISYFSFTQRLGKAMERMRRREEKYVIITSKTGTSRVPIPTIQWIESSGHRLTYHTVDGSYESTTQSMKDVESQLSPEGFFRCNKGYLINLAHVQGVENSYAIVGADRVTVSRAKQRELLDALSAYFGDTIK